MAEQDRCIHHPDVVARHGCVRCQQLICDDCCTSYFGQTYCRQCVEEIVQQKAESRFKSAERDPQQSSIKGALSKRIDSPWVIVIIIVITILIIATEIYVMTR
jgi:uncharacterized membrane protein YvbJ